jgi:predicted anti-sigma-YlaC factor YlaD
MEQKKTTCAGMEAKLADLLLDARPAPAKVQAHVAECEQCRAKLDELKATMNALDAWEAPEPSPYFLTRLGARMREERQAAPAGWFAGMIARVRASIAYGSGLHARPLAAMALTVMLLVGGGTYLGVTDWMQPAQQPGASAAVVHDLQTIDSNAQVLDQLESLSTNTNGD